MAGIEIDVQSVSALLKESAGIAFVDCREPNEYEIAKIDGAILLPMSQWPPHDDALKQLDGKHVIVHCHHGGRSLRVANWFRQNGFPDAQSMAGGIDLWSREIDPSIARY